MACRAAVGRVADMFAVYAETGSHLLAGLACSFIIASGVFKDVGRAVLAGDSIPLFGIPLPNPWPPGEAWPDDE